MNANLKNARIFAVTFYVLIAVPIIIVQNPLITDSDTQIQGQKLWHDKNYFFWRGALRFNYPKRNDIITSLP